MTETVMRSVVAFVEAAHRRAPAGEKTFVNRDGERRARPRGIERITSAGARSEGEQAALESFLQPGLFQVLALGLSGIGGEGGIVAHPPGGAKQVEVAPDRARGEVDRVVEDEPARRDER